MFAQTAGQPRVGKSVSGWVKSAWLKAAGRVDRGNRDAIRPRGTLHRTRGGWLPRNGCCEGATVFEHL